MGAIDQFLHPGAIQVRQDDVEARTQRVAIVSLLEVDLRVDREMIDSHLLLAGFQHDGALDAGRPTGRKQLLGIGSSAGAAGNREVDVELAVVAARLALVTGADSVDFRRVHGLRGGLHHGCSSEAEPSGRSRLARHNLGQPLSLIHYAKVWSSTLVGVQPPSAPRQRQHPSQKIEHQRADLGGVGFQREVASIDEMDPGIGNVGAKVECAGRDQMRVRFAPCRSLVVSGLLNKQIGGELGISYIMVKAHRGKVMRRMSGPSSRW